MDTVRDKALEYLNKDYTLNIDIIEAIRRDIADILLCSQSGILVKTRLGRGCFLLSCDTEEFAVRAAELAENADIICIHQEKFVPMLCDKLSLKLFMECVNSIYSGSLPRVEGEWDIRPLDMSYAREVGAAYYGEYEYVQLLIDRGVLFGCFVDGSLAGFVGEHNEGACGILEVFPEYRRQGIGQALESFINEYELERGFVPYGQIDINNEKSLSMQRKLGMTISAGHVFWLERE